jgi:hypothetical protein
MIRHFACAIFCLVGLSRLACADDPDCSKALVLATYDEQTERSRDWRVANFLSKEEWDEARKQARAKATIFGVPMSADYDEYHSRANKLFTSHDEKLNEHDAREIQWAGITDQSVTAYQSCLMSRPLNGLSASILRITDSDVVLLVRWHNNRAPTPPQLTWDPAQIGGKTFPTKIDPEQTISFPRPKANEITITINMAGGGIVQPITVSPVPPPPKFTTRCEVLFDEKVTIQPSNDSTGPHKEYICAGMPPGSKVSAHFNVAWYSNGLPKTSGAVSLNGHVTEFSNISAPTQIDLDDSKTVGDDGIIKFYVYCRQHSVACIITKHNESSGTISKLNIWIPDKQGVTIKQNISDGP